LGGKWENVKKVFPSHSIGHHAMEHSIGLQAKETFPSPSIGHQALDLPSPPFSFSLKVGLRSWGAFFLPGHNFKFNLEYLFPQAF
jgi:hypothetical protein